MDLNIFDVSQSIVIIVHVLIVPFLAIRNLFKKLVFETV